jgi:DNA-binding PadR family transcriptional regulator
MGRFIRRGSAKLLILNTLASRPMHGYEVAKEISATFKAAYEPSPGVIYPTLQSLEDLGYVEGTHGDGKTVYKMTESGRAFLKQNEDKLEQIAKFAQARMNGDEFPILKSASRLERTIRLYLPEMSKETRLKVAGILDEAAARVSGLVDKA